MTTSHPVDSRMRPCCQGIGNHTQDCITPRPDVPWPTGATYVDEWSDGPRACRAFDGKRWAIGCGGSARDIEVVIAGNQLVTGQVEGLRVLMFADAAELGAAGARELARALIAAADKLERLEGQR